jgi:hypothetical protein
VDGQVGEEQHVTGFGGQGHGVGERDLRQVEAAFWIVLERTAQVAARDHPYAALLLGSVVEVEDGRPDPVQGVREERVVLVRRER